MSPDAKKTTPRSRATPTATKARAASAKAAPSEKAPTNGTFRKPEYTGLRQRYHDEVVPALQREFSYANPMQIPTVEKIVVNIGLGEAIANAKALDRPVPAADGDADRREGDPARAADVRLPGAHVGARPAAHP